MATNPAPPPPASSRSDWGEYARQILRQYNEGDYGGAYRFFGPHYVTYVRGEFRLRPFGIAARYRYQFECRPEIVSWQDEPFWTFVVL